jgi:predicted MFS family arabinose efflux permease
MGGGLTNFRWKRPKRPGNRLIKENLMNQQATNAAPKTSAYAWVVLFALYLATLSATLTLSKVMPVSTILQKTFSVDMVKAGQLMAVFSIMGFVLAIPAGFILKRFGIKMTGLISVGAVVIGSVIGALAESFFMLMTGRFIEGVGMGLIMVTAPFAISVWFPQNNRALPNGLWATSVGIGNIVMFLSASNMAVKYGWQSVWWAGAGFAALSFILFAILFRMPKPEEMEAAPAPPPAAGEEAAPSLIKGMANASFWMVAIAFGVYNLVVMAMISFLPQFLEVERGYSLTYDNGYLMNAGFVTALVMAVSVLSAPGGGYISDRLGKRKMMILVPYILMTLTFFFPFTVTGSMIPVYMIVFGLVGGPIAPVLLAAVPEVAKKPQYIGIGMGVGALGQNLGIYLGTSQFPQIQAAAGWEAAGYWMIPICLVGIIAACFIKVR